jgi:hypothetical protein
MSRIAFTLRMGTEEHAALESLSELEGRPINQLLNEAIKTYLSRVGGKERRLEANLARLRTYRKLDPAFGKAIAAFVEAEATLEDPIEGHPVSEAADSEGPVQSKLRELMGA